MSTSNDNPSAVAAAIEFVATQAGGAERILKHHFPLPGSGMCAGCRVVPTRHPCTAARIAELAKERSTDNRRDLDTSPTLEYWRRLAAELWGKS